MKKQSTTLKLHNPDTGFYFRNAYHVCNLMITPSTERIAWEGTAALYQNKSGYFLEYHTGNSAHDPASHEIAKREFERLKAMAEEGIEGVEMKEAVFQAMPY